MKKISRLCFAIGMFLFFVLIVCPNSQAKEDELCGDIWAVKSVQVDPSGLLIRFDTASGGFQVVYKVDGERIVPLEYGEFFSAAAGETIGWGDGDHAFMSLAVLSIAGERASVVLTDQHMPPGGAAVFKSRTCVISDSPNSEKGDVFIYENSKK